MDTWAAARDTVTQIGAMKFKMIIAQALYNFSAKLCFDSQTNEIRHKIGIFSYKLSALLGDGDSLYEIEMEKLFRKENAGDLSYFTSQFFYNRMKLAAFRGSRSAKILCRELKGEKMREKGSGGMKH